MHRASPAAWLGCSSVPALADPRSLPPLEPPVLSRARSPAAAKTGDGKFDGDDIKAIQAKLLGFLSQNVPSAGGFAAGFTTALKMF